MQLLEKELELSKEYTHQYDGKSELTKEYLFQLFQDTGYRSQETFDEMVAAIGLETDVKDWMLDGEEYKGNLPGRISKYIQLRNSQFGYYDREYINNGIASRTSSRLQQVEFVLGDLIDWEAGTFKESRSSCWWDDYAEGKREFMYHCRSGNGFVMKFFKDGNPFGRCFATFKTDTHDFILFNIYVTSGYSQYDILNILSSYFGMDYQVVALNFDSCESIYVNNSKGYLFGAPLEADKKHITVRIDCYQGLDDAIDELSYLDNNYDDEDDYDDPPQEECPNCGEYVDEGSLRVVHPQGTTVCAYCERRVFPRGVVYDFHNHRYCDRSLYHISKATRRVVKTKAKADGN